MKTLRDMETTVFNRINPAINFSVSRYVLSIGIFVAVVVFGFISIFGLGVDLLPAMVIPSVNVSVSYPGATPGVVDQQVTQLIENAVSTMSNITGLNSTSSTGSSRVSISFDTSVDKNAAANQVASLVAGVTRRLPSGAGTPAVQTFDPNSEPILQFGVCGGAANLTDVGDYVQNTLVPDLELVPGVANIQTDGAPSRQFQVLLDPDKLQYYGLNPSQVIAAITSSAVSTPIGTITSQNSMQTFTTQNVPSDLGQIGRTLVDASRGITVDDVAGVRIAPSSSNYARVNGIPCILVSVQRTSDSNSVAVVKEVRALLASSRLPSGYSIIVSNDTTGPIQASIDSTYRELLNTALVVAVILLLFLGKLDTAFSVILAIPIALSASPILYRFAGFSFNLVSLLALIIAIGIVVDDSIVVAENVERYRAMGFGLKDAVLQGASEVFSAVVAASLSILSVLLPVSFLGGFIGRYLQQFSLGLAAAVAFSLLEALLFLTVRLAYTHDARTLDWDDFLKSWTRLPEAFRWGFRSWRKGFGILLGLAAAAGIWYFTKKPLYLAGLISYPIVLGLLNYVVRVAYSFLSALTTTLHNGTEAALKWVREGYTRSLSGLLDHSIPVLIAAAAFLAVSAVVILPRLPFNFVPQTDSGYMRVNIRFPTGTPSLMANQGTGRVESYLLQRPEVSNIQATIGSSGSVTVQLAPIGQRPSLTALSTQYRRDISALFRDMPSVRISVGGSGGGGFGGGFGSALQLNITAADIDKLQERNGRILQVLQDNPYVADVTSSLSDVNFQNEFLPDPSRLKGTGITPSQIAAVLQTYTSGSQASNVVTGGLSYPIQVMADPTIITGQQSLLNLPIYSSTLQTSLQIGQLGQFQLREAPVSLSRSNRQYMGQLSMNLKPDAPTALTLQNQIEEDLTKAGLIGGDVKLSTGSSYGQAALASQLAATGPQIFLLAFFLAYLVMAAQFNSWRYPIYLLLPVPLALVGALWLIFLIGGGLDIFGLMGMLMLIGLSAKNAILYLDFVVERIGKMPFRDALSEAARLRFRPIVMTTLTVLVISFPLIFSRGQGAEFGQRMGIVMLGGIFFSAILTFFVVPAAFYLFERRRVAAVEEGARKDGTLENAAP